MRRQGMKKVAPAIFAIFLFRLVRQMNLRVHALELQMELLPRFIAKSLNRAIVTSKSPIDIVFAVDTSGSMDTEQSLLQEK